MTTVSTLDAARASMRASDLRMVAKETAGISQVCMGRAPPRCGPPVGAWVADYEDTELHVWHRLPGGRGHVDLLFEEAKKSEGGRAYPRFCKMNRHSPKAPLYVMSRHGDREEWFEALSEVTVRPDWPDRMYQDEGESLLRLGRAHEDAKRHDAMGMAWWMRACATII